MGLAAAGPAAPLLAGGPPGWLAYVAVVVGSTFVAAIVADKVIDAATQDDAAAVPQTGDATSTQNCRNWSVRVHAQGNIIGGTGKATLGAPRILKPAPVTVAEGLVLSNATFSMLGRRQAKILKPAKIRLDEFISKQPANGGFLNKWSEYPVRGKNDRMDVDSFGCSPNFIG